MNKKTIKYEAPVAELLVVRFEGNFCNTGVPGGAGGSDPYAPGDGEDLD